eukprot:PhF_6_TR609/c0_g1_i2/m.767
MEDVDSSANPNARNRNATNNNNTKSTLELCVCDGSIPCGGEPPLHKANMSLRSAFRWMQFYREECAGFEVSHCRRADVVSSGHEEDKQERAIVFRSYVHMAKLQRTTRSSSQGVVVLRRKLVQLLALSSGTFSISSFDVVNVTWGVRSTAAHTSSVVSSVDPSESNQRERSITPIEGFQECASYTSPYFRPIVLDNNNEEEEEEENRGVGRDCRRKKRDDRTGEIIPSCPPHSKRQLLKPVPKRPTRKLLLRARMSK